MKHSIVWQRDVRRAVRIASITVGIAIAVVLGCGHDAKPAVAPDEHPPLPPASGTPIGYLIDDASELALRDDQVVQLKAIDDDLAARLDADGRGPRTAPAAAPTPTAGRHGGGGGGRHGGHRRGSGAGAARTAPAASGSAADLANRTTQARTADVHDALVRAFTVLDPAQQPIARRVLADHGVDLDATGPAAPPSRRGEPTEPDAGSDD